MKKDTPYLTKLIAKLTPKVGARVVIEPKWKYAAQIIYPNGIVRSLRYFSLDLNSVGSSDIARDKDYAKFFMKRLGYPVAPGDTVFEKNWADAIGSKKTFSYGARLAGKLGYPVIVKPNSKSQGLNVSLAWNKSELLLALREVFKDDKVALVERYLPGRDYRIVVLDKKIISAYERIPLSVVGDGKNPILKLLKEKQKIFMKNGRDTRIDFKDRRTLVKLKQLRHNLKTILPKGEKVFLLDNANLSTGGDSLDVTNTIHQGFKKIAINLTKQMGLRLSGVDIMVRKGDITKDPKDCKYYIIEINSAPGLDHYVTTGRKQKKIVESMYLQILKALGKKNKS